MLFWGPQNRGVFEHDFRRIDTHDVKCVSNFYLLISKFIPTDKWQFNWPTHQIIQKCSKLYRKSVSILTVSHGRKKETICVSILKTSRFVGVLFELGKSRRPRERHGRNRELPKWTRSVSNWWQTLNFSVSISLRSRFLAHKYRGHKWSLW